MTYSAGILNVCVIVCVIDASMAKTSIVIVEEGLVIQIQGLGSFHNHIMILIIPS